MMKVRGRKSINVTTKKGGKGWGDPEYEWVKVEAIVDSGAAETLCGTQHVSKDPVRQTKASKRGEKHLAADGGELPNLDEGDIKGESDEGIPVSLTAQVSDRVSRIQVAVHRICQDGNMVVFGADRAALKKLAESDVVDDNCIMNKKSGVKSRVMNDGGLYTYSIWRKKEVRRDVPTIDGCRSDCKGDDDAWSPF